MTKSLIDKIFNDRFYLVEKYNKNDQEFNRQDFQ